MSDSKRVAPEQMTGYAASECYRCPACKMPLLGTPEGHLPDCAVRQATEINLKIDGWSRLERGPVDAERLAERAWMRMLTGPPVPFAKLPTHKQEELIAMAQCYLEEMTNEDRLDKGNRVACNSGSTSLEFVAQMAHLGGQSGQQESGLSADRCSGAQCETGASSQEQAGAGLCKHCGKGEAAHNKYGECPRSKYEPLCPKCHTAILPSDDGFIHVAGGVATCPEWAEPAEPAERTSQIRVEHVTKEELAKEVADEESRCPSRAERTQGPGPRCPMCGEEMSLEFRRTSIDSKSAVKVRCLGNELSEHEFVLFDLAQCAQFFLPELDVEEPKK